MKRFLVKCVLLLLVVAGFFFLYKNDRYSVNAPREGVERAAEQLSEQLAANNDLLMLITFDESPPVEWVHGAQIIQSGVEAVPGVFGNARRFNGYHRTFIETSIDWKRVEGSFTLSTWVRLHSVSQNQEVLFSRTLRTQAGIRLDQGRMAFFIPVYGRPQAVSYPFERYDEYVHIVAVADLEQKKAFLYENGQLKASGPIDEIIPPHNNVEFGKRNWTGVRQPLNGDLDETAIWNRALSEKEVASLYRRRVSLLRSLEPVAYYRWRIADRFNAAVRTALKWSDYFHPGLHEGRTRHVELPELDLLISRSVRRHLNRAHGTSMEAGIRTRAASAERPIQFVFEGEARAGTLQLGGSSAEYPSVARPSYVLNLESGEAINGMHRILLTPPESAGFIQPLLESRVAEQLNIPSVRNGLCRLRINGDSVGIYYFEDYTQMGMFPGSGVFFPYGPTLAGDWHSLFREFAPNESLLRLPLSGGVPLDEASLFALYDEVEKETRALFVNDLHSSLNSREILYHLKWNRRRLLEHWPLAPVDTSLLSAAWDTLNEYMLLGENPSPLYLVDDLDLNVFSLPGARISYASSNPEVLTDDGTVIRPAGDRPVEVELVATIRADRRRRDKSLRFRVMPQEIKVPALMVYVNQPLKKARRVDAVVHQYPGGNPDEMRSFRASQHTRGGISHRGHTGYWKRRKSFSLRLDEPHGLLADTDTRHLHLVNASRDPAFVRNKLSYDLWRAFGTDESPRYTPEVQWTELFVNGRYHCLIEQSSRVDRRLFGYDAYDPDEPDQALIYKRNNLRLWTVGRRTDMRAIYPPRRFDHSFSRYHVLLDIISNAPDDVFARELDAHMDVANLIDFHILLNFAENRNGWPFNYYVHDILVREPGPDGRFFMVPWDFDATFQKRRTWYANNLLRRMQEDYPDYYAMKQARWEQLRAGPLHDDRIRERLDAMETQLAGYVEWDYDRWGRNEGRPHAEFVEVVRTHALARAAFLDEEIAARAAGSAMESETEDCPELFMDDMDVGYDEDESGEED